MYLFLSFFWLAAINTDWGDWGGSVVHPGPKMSCSLKEEKKQADR